MSGKTNLSEQLLPYFSFLDPAECAEWIASFSLKELDAGELLFEEGDVADTFFVMLSGQLAVQKRTGFADRCQVVGLLGPGAIVGENGLQSGLARSARLVAVEDSSLAALSVDMFLAYAEAHPKVGFQVLQWALARTSLRLQKCSERLAHIL